MDENRLSGLIIGCAIKVHKALGPGLLEHVYKECLIYELKNSGILTEREVPLPVIYDNVKLDCGFRMDILVEKKVVIEIKSVEEFLPIHLAQVLTYLKLGQFRLGLLLNFNVSLLSDGIKRVAMKL